MAVVNYDEKWIYFMEPHTASRAVNNALLKDKACHYAGPHHSTISQITDMSRDDFTSIPMEKLLGFDSICTVRNPLDMLVSRWRLGKGQFISFHDFVAKNNQPNRLQSHLSGFWKSCNIVCYFENLQADLNFVFGREIPIEHNNLHRTLEKKPWSDYYDRDTFDSVTKYFADYSEKFGYQHEWQDNKAVTYLDASSRMINKVGSLR